MDRTYLVPHRIIWQELLAQNRISLLRVPLQVNTLKKDIGKPLLDEYGWHSVFLCLSIHYLFLSIQGMAFFA